MRVGHWLQRGRAALPRVLSFSLVCAVGMLFGVNAMSAQPPPAKNYVRFAAELPALFAPSTRVTHYGLTGLASIYRQHTTLESLATFGLVLTVLAVFGLIVSWQPSAKP